MASHILQPAKHLRVPGSVAISMLRLFIASIALCSHGGEDMRPNIFFHRGYRTQLMWLAHDTSLKNLAAKFILDGTVLLDAVVLCPDFRRLLRTRMIITQARWFKTIASPSDFEIAKGEGAHVAASGCDSREKAMRERYPGSYQSGQLGWNSGQPALHIRDDCWRARCVRRSLTDQDDWITKVLRWHFKPSRLCIDAN